MKICFIIASLANGGAERVLATLANSFCKKHEVKIIKFNQDEPFYKIDKSIEISSFPAFKCVNLFDKIMIRFKKFFALRRALKNAKSDIFISFLDSTNIACIVAKWGLKTPLIICEHSSHSYLKSKFWRILRRVFYPHCAALTVLSEDDKNIYKAFVKNVKVLLNPCEFSICENAKKQNCVIFVGRLDENKNAKMFLNAINFLSLKLQESCEFLVVGDGVEGENLRKLAQNLKISVNFLGKTKNIKSIYERAKIICLCSFVEGLPSVLIESIFFNVARISTKYRGAKLIDDGKDGFLVECDDSKAMGEKIALLLNDEKMREKITKNAQKNCEKFSVKSIERQWFELINEVLNESQKDDLKSVNLNNNLQENSRIFAKNTAKNSRNLQGDLKSVNLKENSRKMAKNSQENSRNLPKISQKNSQNSPKNITKISTKISVQKPPTKDPK